MSVQDEIDDEAMANKRQYARHRTFLRGKVEFNNRMSSLDCTIRDLSDGGARLELAETVAIPESFDLVVPAKSLKRAAYIKWRTTTHVGIIFAETLRAAAADRPSMERRLKELEEENAELRRIIGELRAADDKRLAV